jgi:tetratricopeptide (TPR) repeat protein
MKRTVASIGAALLATASLPGIAWASRAAAGEIDVQRLLRDRDYAAGMIVHLDRVAAAAADDPEMLLEVDSLRGLALAVLERAGDAAVAIDRVLGQRPAETHFYARAWFSSRRIGDSGRALAVLEQASRNVPGVRWARLREFLGRHSVWSVIQGFEEARDYESQVRMAEALLRIGWPGPTEVETADSLRSIVVNRRMARGDRAGAAEMAAGISTPLAVLPLIVQRRYDPLFAEGTDRLARFRSAVEAHDARTAEAAAGAPQNVNRILERAQFLRTLARDAEALALLEPFTRDLRATVTSDEMGLWLVNEAVYAMISLGRKREGAELMGRLATLPLSEYPNLISASINYAEVLWEVGRYDDSLAHARLLERDFSGHASDYGKMWVRAAIVCALSSLGRAGEAAPTLAQMREGSATNQAALMRAYLCLDDMAAAEALMISRLASDEPEGALLALQDYGLSNPAADPDPLLARLQAVAARPAVRAALERVGRVLQLPVTRTYYGGL